MAEVKSWREEVPERKMSTMSSANSQDQPPKPAAQAEQPVERASEMSDPYDWSLALQELQRQRHQLYSAFSQNLSPCLACGKTFRSHASLCNHLHQHHREQTQREQDHHQASEHLQQGPTRREPVQQLHSEGLQQHHCGNIQQPHSQKAEKLQPPSKVSVESSTLTASLDSVGDSQEKHHCRSYCIVDIRCSACRKFFPTVDEWRCHIKEVHGKIPGAETEDTKKTSVKTSLKTSAEVGKETDATVQTDVGISTHRRRQTPSSAQVSLRTGWQVSTWALTEKCRICGQRFRLKSGLKRHMTRKHSGKRVAHLGSARKAKEVTASEDQEPAQSSSIRRRTKFQCQQCKAQFEQLWEARIHEQVEHQGLPLACPSVCGVFPNMAELREHVARAHSNFNFPCTHCGKSFHEDHKCREHVATVHKIVNFPCPICGKSFARRCKAQLHMQIVHKKVRFSCNQSTKKFSHKHRLRDHEDFVHKNIIKYSCSDCGKNFEQKPVYQEHVKTAHKTPYTFACSKCHKRFPKMSALKHHVDGVHKGARRECPHCHKSFASTENLRRHTNLFHPTAFRHRCTQCGLGFVHAANLHKHELKLHPKGNVECSLCHTDFPDQPALITHLNQVHTKKEK